MSDEESFEDYVKAQGDLGRALEQGRALHGMPTAAELAPTVSARLAEILSGLKSGPANASEDK